jgi:Putative phage serine protease XkdF
MTISKAQWNSEGENLRLSMPFSKVDKERRIVSGFASLDNLDKQMDIVTAEASMDAFAKFRGNIREMHQPLAVGKMVNFKAEKYFDPESKKFYNGVFVSAYVSKGAQDTWEKVMDGTLTGFSIGGRMNKWDDGYDEKSESQIRIIKEYDLVELSLVDSPANQFANIVSVEKVDGVDIVKGDETILENVFYDKEAGIVVVSENESEVSPVSGDSMQNIGFVEKSDNEKASMIKFLVDSAKGINTSKINKEVNPMTEETAVVEETTEVTKSEEVAPEVDAKADTVEEATEEATEKAAKPASGAADSEEDSEDEEDAEDMEKKKPEVSKSDEAVAESIAEIKNTLTSAFSDLVSTVKSLQAEVEMLKSSKVDVNTVKDSFDAVAKDIAAVSSGFNEFGKRVELVEQDTAFRKSGDLGEIVQNQPETVEKSLWGGSFLKTADLFK